MIGTQGQASFQARISRINSGQVSQVPQPGVSDGSGTCWITHKSARRMQKRAAPETGRTASPSGLFGFVLGLLAFVLSQLGGYHLFGLPDSKMTGDIRMLLDGVGAMAVLATVSLVFAAPSKRHMAVRIAGVAVAMATMHNLVHMAPEVFAMAFSAEWVEATRAASEPGSILFRGVSIPLS